MMKSFVRYLFKQSALKRSLFGVCI
uniref:Uncharacterized protein n=1 Tax=Anguilla anguilla TaxID=7936 RepID=A0A0E9UXN8_ANGAN